MRFLSCRRRAASLAIAVLTPLLAWAPPPANQSADAPAPSAALPERSTLPTSGLVAEGIPRLGDQIDTPGRRSAWFGTEKGSLEAWVYPLKVVRDLELSFRFRDQLIQGRDLVRWVEVRPEWTAITYGHEAFRVRQIVATPIEAAINLILLEVDASFPLSIEVAFHVDLQPMWPAGLGGQYSYWDAELPGFVIGEGRGATGGLIASPAATDPTIQPAHSLPDQPTRFTIQVDPEVAASHWYPIVVGAWTRGMDAPSDATALRKMYAAVAADPGELLAGNAAHYRELEQRLATVELEPGLDEAVRWAKVRLDQGLVCNPHLGCGLVAGYAGSGAGYRPGFAWFFGGDAFYNSWALTALGAHDTVRSALDMLARNQREDGKIMHELSQGAGTLDWFEDYPYGYYHAEPTPYFVDAIVRHTRATGDLDWARALLPRLRRAYEYCVSTDTDGDGLMENTSAGLGAVEMGALREARVHQDIYLASVWTRALAGLPQLAAALGESNLAADATDRHQRAQASLERNLWMADRSHFAFGSTTAGGRLEELTLWSVLPSALELADAETSARNVATVASPAITTDWGTRMLATSSQLYDPLIYNQGTVWPFLTGFAAQGAFAVGNSAYGRDLLVGLARLTHDHSRGAIHEVLSGDRYEPMGPSVPHQIFGTSSIVTPLLTGLLGLDVDLLAGRIRIAPRLSAYSAGRFEVPVGGGRLRVQVSGSTPESPQHLRVDVELDGWQGVPPELSIAPGLPAGAAEIRASTDVVESRAQGEFVVVEAAPGWSRREDGVLEASLWLQWRGGIPIQVGNDPRAVAAGPSRGLRVLSSQWRADSLHVQIAGRAGEHYRLRFPAGTTTQFMPLAEVPGASPALGWRIEDTGAGDWHRLTLEGDGDGYVSAELVLRR